MFTPATMKPDEAATVGAYVERLQQQNAALLAALREIAASGRSVPGYDSPSALLLRLVGCGSVARAAIAACEGK